MKTINNVQKTTLRSAAVIAVLVLTSFMLNAQEFEEGLVAWNSNKEKTVLVNNKASNDYVMIGEKAYAKDWLDEFIKTETEKTMSMERWMFIDVSKKAKPENDLRKSTASENETDLSVFYEKAEEETLKVEDWMFNSMVK